MHEPLRRGSYLCLRRYSAYRTLCPVPPNRNCSPWGSVCPGACLPLEGFACLGAWMMAVVTPNFPTVLHGISSASESTPGHGFYMKSCHFPRPCPWKLSRSLYFGLTNGFAAAGSHLPLTLYKYGLWRQSPPTINPHFPIAL